MIIAERKLETEQKFNTKQAEREQHLKNAEECLTEMTKLQGEYRVLEELEDAEKQPKVDKAKTIEVENK